MGKRYNGQGNTNRLPSHIMKKTLFLLVAILASFSPIHANDAELPMLPSFVVVPNQEAGVVLSSLEDYCYFVVNPHADEHSAGYPGMSADEARANALRVIKANPQHVNEGFYDHGLVTPLVLAVAIQDSEITKALLDAGAIPFLPGGDLLAVKPAYKVKTDPEVKKLIQNAQAAYSPEMQQAIISQFKK